MVIQIFPNGLIEWRFYRKAFRKARWRKLGSRCLKNMLKTIEDDGLKGGLIIVK